MIGILRPVLRVLFGTASAQAIALLSMPIISRLYTPADYGIFGATIAIIALAVIVSTLQLHQAIVLPKSNGTAIRLCRISCEGSVIGGTVVVFLLLIYTSLADAEGRIPSTWPLLAGLSVTASGVSQSLQALAVRGQAFMAVAKAAVIRVIVVACVQIVFGLMGYGASGLLFGFVFGEMTLASVLAVAIKSRSAALRRPQCWQRKKSLIIDYGDFAKYGTPMELLNSASQGAPTLLLGWFFGPSVAGYYVFAIRILLAPAQLIGNAVRQVVSQRFAVLSHGSGQLGKEFRIVTIVLLAAGIVGAVITFSFLPNLFEVIFGSEWEQSGYYGSWLIFWVAFVMANAPSSVILRVLRKQKENFYFNVAIFLSRIAVLLLGGLLWTATVTVATFAVIGVIYNVIFIGLAWKYASQYEG